MTRLDLRHESWPLRGTFTISRGSRTSAEVVVVELSDGEHTGRGECVPYARYGESIDSVMGQIEALRTSIEQGVDRPSLQSTLSPGAARNALDCACWDLEAKQSGRSIWQCLGTDPGDAVTTAYTLSLDAPEKMQLAAEANAGRPLLKIKLGGHGDEDIERVRAVRSGAPAARLILDANEGWDAPAYEAMIAGFIDLDVSMIEQPFPAADDGLLADLDRPITICADESCHDTSTLGQLAGKYDMINIKLDKTGGLSEALQLRSAAEDLGFEIMVGCMMATSLAMAPALVIAQGASIIDLDGPLWLAEDRAEGLDYRGSRIMPLSPALWG